MQKVTLCGLTLAERTTGFFALTVKSMRRTCSAVFGVVSMSAILVGLEMTSEVFVRSTKVERPLKALTLGSTQELRPIVI